MVMVRYLCLIGLMGMSSAAVAEKGVRPGRAFLGWDEFTAWTQVAAPSKGITVYESPAIRVPSEFDQLILSWNIPNSGSRKYTFTVAVRQEGAWSNEFVLGHWVSGTFNDLRTSENGQADKVARVLTDTLVLAHPSNEVRIRVEQRGEASDSLDIAFLGLSAVDTRVALMPRKSDRAAWGTELAVPQRCQMDYPGGEVWCSPTSVGMVLAHWASVLSRPELRRSVPSIAAEVFDLGWEGTGNWSFNTAFAGTFEGIRAYVVRLSDVTDLEAWIVAGVPVTVSVAYSVLKQSPPRTNDGHLIVCVGFTEAGDIIVNDPARSGRVRWVYDRSDFIAAWRRSRNTAYLIYPESFPLPADPWGLWATRSR